MNNSRSELIYDLSNNLINSYYENMRPIINKINNSYEMVRNSVYEYRPYINGHYLYHTYMNNKQEKLLKELNDIEHELISFFCNEMEIKELIEIYNYNLKLQNKLENLRDFRKRNKELRTMTYNILYYS
jgi:hypothetical protein